MTRPNNWVNTDDLVTCSSSVVQCAVLLCSMYDRDSEEAMKMCRALLTEPDCNRAVRYGDVYGMMAEHYARLQQWKAVSNQ